MRFSTPTQATGDSKRRQYKQAEEYASANGLELDDALRYDDYGVSAFRGANVEIGKLGQFMEAIRRGEVVFGSFLLVESLDRISRDLILPAQNIFTQIILEGITIVTLADSRKYSVELVNKYPFLLIEAIVILIRANEESTIKSLRAKANWENRRACLSTKLMTSLIPAWLYLNTESNRLEIIPERGAIINRIYQERLDGKSTRNIAKDLDQDNIPTWVTCNKKRAVTWSYHYIWRILSSPGIIGTLVPRKRAQVSGIQLLTRL
jgi:DNA invertase Pin-like site-specific DNA recombinase